MRPRCRTSALGRRLPPSTFDPLQSFTTAYYLASNLPGTSECPGAIPSLWNRMQRFQDDKTGSASSGLIAAVGIGRHPNGRDP